MANSYSRCFIYYMFNFNDRFIIMYEAKQIKFTYDSKTLLIKKDKEIREDIETCKNILNDLQNVINIREKHEAKHQKWWDDRKTLLDKFEKFCLMNELKN